MSSFLGGGGSGFPLYEASPTNPLTFFVSTTGSDSNNGLTSGTAWATLQHSANFIAANVLFAGGHVVVKVAAGTYVGFGVPGCVGSGTLQYYGQGYDIGVNPGGAPVTTINNGPNDGFINTGESISTNFAMSVQFAFQGFNINAGTGNCLIVSCVVIQGDQVGMANTKLVYNFTNNNTELVRVINYAGQFGAAGGRIGSLATINLGGINTPQILRLDFGGQFFDQNQWTVNNNATFQNGFITVNNNSLYSSLGASFTITGTPTGSRASMFSNGEIVSNRGSGVGILGQNFFPGNSPPFATDLTCVYDNYILPTGNVSGGFSPLIPDTQTASYTVQPVDINNIIEMNVAVANTVTVAPFSSVALPVGFVTKVVQAGVGQTTIVAGAGVTGHNFGALAAQWSTAVLYQRAQDEWVQTL